MHDILSQGGDREPSPWPRRLAVIAALVLVAVGSVAYLNAQRHPSDPSGIAGRTLPWASGLRLPVTGTQPAWFSPASGRSVPIGGLPVVSSGYQFIRIVGGWAVQANPAASVACNDCAKPSMPVWFLADGARSVIRVGTANLVAPSATAGAMWLTSYPPGVTMSTAAGTAREVSTTGTPMRPRVSLPSGYVIDQATDRGLLLAPVSQQATPADKLWDPAAPRASRAFGTVIAASPTEIAWASRCAPACQVQVLDLATGRHTVVRLPVGSSPASGAFSPSGGFLALQVSSDSLGDNGALALRLDVASVATGRLTAVPGTWVSSDALVGFGWPARGDSLVAEFIFTTKAQLASWNPGAARPAVTLIRPGHTQTSLILG
jgi:hypothetical protein